MAQHTHLDPQNQDISTRPTLVRSSFLWLLTVSVQNDYRTQTHPAPHPYEVTLKGSDGLT